MSNLKGRRSIWALLLLCAALAVSAQAKIGYDISVDVENSSSSWSVHRSTQDTNFELTGSCSGEGRFSRLTHINGFAGIEADESTYSTYNGSKLSYDERMRLISREGPVIILKELKSEAILNKSEISTNKSINETIITKESANITIGEFWPTYFTNYKKISYNGRSIRSRECYQNNGDIVSTSIDSWDLDKESLYASHINKTVIVAKITPTSVIETKSANKSSHYILDLSSVGILTHLGIGQRDPNGDYAYYISEDYMGQQKMTLKVDMAEQAPILEFEEDPKEWLQCCIAEESDKRFESAIWRPEDEFLYIKSGFSDATP